MPNIQSTKKITALIFCVLIILVVASVLHITRKDSSDNLTAEIKYKNEVVATIPLTDSEHFFSLDDVGVPITFELRGGAIRFVTSSCADKICVNSGFKSRANDIASCLPNGVVLIITE